MIDARPRYIEVLKLQPDYALIYQEYVGNGSKKPHDKSLSNLSKNKHNGEISLKARNRLHTALDWMLLISKKKTANNLKKSGQFIFKISMLTLTLPCKQLHSDLFIKKMMLNEFLTIIRKKHNLQNYIWKAEKQENGNIHFHIIIDKYIIYSDINRIWNNILKTHGYIDEYRKNQEKKHVNGFFYDKKKSKHWNKSAQLKAYKNGVRTHWQCPTATTDIHSLKKIKNAKSYLSKYITKNPDIERKYNDVKTKLCQRYSINDLPEKMEKEIKEKIKKKLSIIGNLWYISRSLSELKGIRCDISDNIRKELNGFRKKYVNKVIEKDFCTIFKFSIKDIFKMKLPHLSDVVRKYIEELRTVFYPPNELTGSQLGLALDIFD